jgi:hypothetical protein
MNYIICALAVYKLIQIADALSPREAMPWVKVIVGVVVSYGTTFILDFSDHWLAGLVVATLAGAVHSLLRLLTFLGDMASKRSLK